MKWLALEVLAPIILVVAVWWPGGPIVFHNLPYLFHKVFASGDLLPIALLILIAIYGDLREQPIPEVPTSSVGNFIYEFAAYGALLTGLAVLITYAFAKVAYIPYHFSIENEKIAPNIEYAAQGCIALTVVSVCVAILGKVVMESRKS